MHPGNLLLHRTLTLTLTLILTLTLTLTLTFTLIRQPAAARHSGSALRDPTWRWRER